MTQPTHLIGVDIGGTNLRVALANVKGEIVARVATTTTNVREPRSVIEKIRECAQRLLEDARVSPGACSSLIGVGAPGLTDAENGVVIATSYLMGWRDVPLKAMLEDALGVPACTHNDVNLAALGESRFRAGRGLKDFVFISIGTGVGAGIMLNGELFSGAGVDGG